VDVVTSYIELGLRLGRHIDGLVDAYYGPPEIPKRVEAEEVQDPAALAGDARRLLESVADDGWLQAQLIGLETVALRLAGEELAYEDEVERCYGVRPQHVPEDVFADAHRELDEVLPGSGSVAERYQAWRENDAVPGDALARVMEGLIQEFRGRTKALFGLPDGEHVELEYVSDEPWAAYNYYLGDLRSRIALNTDVAMTPDFVAELAAHETYPGHHTEHVWKEQVLVRDGSSLAESILMIGTPQSLVSEGIAGLGPEILLEDAEEEVTAAHVAGVGASYDAELSRAVKRARQPFERVTGNAALMIHSGGASHDETRDYLMRWALSSERRADQQMKFITDPIWRAYVTTYADGYRICRDFVAGDPQRFERLLTEQLSPADLLAAA
jgi:hypothetical protein